MKKYVFAIVCLFCLLSLVSFCSPVKSGVSLRSSLLDQEDSIIPSKYKVVSGINAQLNSNSYVWTGVNNDSPWSLRLRVVVIENLNNNARPLFGAYGLYSTGNVKWQGFGFIRYGKYGRPVYGDSYGGLVAQTWVANSIHDVEFQCENGNAILTIDGSSTKVFNPSIPLNGYPICLFGFSLTYSYSPSDIIEEVIIERDGEVVANLIPCIRLSDGEPVFYDIVQKQERYNESGPGKLIAYEY